MAVLHIKHKFEKNIWLFSVDSQIMTNFVNLEQFLEIFSNMT